MKFDISVIIPAKNEEWLGLTVEDLLRNSTDRTEIIVILDGYETAVPAIPESPRVTILTNTESKGQRAATNQGVAYSKAKYIIKVDAHCAFDKEFDVKMLEAFERSGDDVVMVPVMRNLHVFDWVCIDGHRRYQGPSGNCTECGEPTEKEVMWIPKTNPQSVAYCFDEEPHFQYAGWMKRRPEYSKQLKENGLTESMSIQGSFFMMSREKYIALNINDESLGSWGSQGIEVACKMWLSGGRVLVNHETWYAHCFRTQGGDFGFPYKQEWKQVNGAKKTVRELFFDNKWSGQVRPLSWLLDRFWPVPGWSDEMYQKIKGWPLPIKNPSVGILHYTDNEMSEPLASRVREQILKGIPEGAKLVSASLKPLDFGENIVLPLERGNLALHKQILAGLKALNTDIVFFVEHDVLYHPSHFAFRPPKDDTFYYNMNLWRVRQSDGFAVRYDHKSLSQLCAFRKLLIPEYEERVRKIEAEGFHRNGYEPGTRSLARGGFSDSKSAHWLSEFPNIDIRHGKNLSASKWKQEDFRSRRSCRNWVESTVEKIEGWEELSERIK